MAIKLKKSRTPGGVEEARLIAWRGLKAAEEALYSAAKAGDRSGVISSIHAIGQSCASYVKLIESSDVDKRLTELEKLHAERPRTGHTLLTTNGN